LKGDFLRRVLFLLILFCSIAFSQDIKFIGEAKPGSVMIGYGDKIVRASISQPNKTGSKQNLLVSKNGRFIFGFDGDAKGTFTLRIKQKGQKEKVFNYELVEKEHEKQELSLPPKYVNPPSRYSKKIARETLLMKKARTKMLGIKTPFYMSGFQYPVDSVEISGEFGVKRILNGKPKNEHNGLDFRGAEGDSVYAIADGIVRLAAEKFFFNGTFVLLDHGQGLSSVYLHLSKLYVKNGDKVKKGELIGEIGSTGRATGPHLHLGIQWFKKRIDPRNIFELQLN
jgi:murein DD-endopeptidase MepM/ murein hydrolase activator NlpD